MLRLLALSGLLLLAGCVPRQLPPQTPDPAFGAFGVEGGARAEDDEPVDPETDVEVVEAEVEPPEAPPEEVPPSRDPRPPQP